MHNLIKSIEIQNISKTIAAIKEALMILENARKTEINSPHCIVKAYHVQQGNRNKKAIYIRIEEI